MRRLLAQGLAALALATPLWSQAPSVIVGVGGELSEPVGVDFFAPVFADMRSSGGARLGSYTVRITWDPAVLQYLAVEAGVFGQPVVQTDSTYYGVLMAAAISVGGLDGIVDLFRIKLHVLKAQTSAMTIQVKELSAASTFADLRGSVALVNGTFCPALGRWGDLDSDGSADSRDALAILTSVVGIPVDTIFHLNLGDVNGDGLTNTLDALIILSYAVGIDIPGQRVLLVAPGSCGTGVAPSLVVVPDTADLVVGQRVHLKAQARTSSGYAALAATWSVADPAVADVDGQGLLVGRRLGTTKLTAALGPGIRFSAPVVVRVRRGAWYVDGPAAKRASVQLGTSKWPFSTPQRAFPYVSEGDTIHLRPGVHDYENASDEGVDPSELTDQLRVGVVIQGDTLPNGTRPVLRGPANNFSYGVNWVGGQHGEIRDVILRGFYYGAYVAGLANLTVQNLRVENPLTYYGYGYGIYASAAVDTLQVLKSELLADTRFTSNDAIHVNVGAKLVVIRDTRVTYWGSAGFLGYDVDSLDVQGSEFSYNNFRGIYLTTSRRPSVSARISHSRFLDDYWEAMNVTGARLVALDHNYILHKRNAGVRVFGVSPTLAGSKLILLGDSIRDRTSYGWIDASALDTVLIDSLWMESPRDTAQGQNGSIRANYARLTRSRLLNLYSQGFTYYGRKLEVDNTQFTGCAAALCTWNSATAVTAFADNDSGPAISLTNSSFSVLSRALYQYGINTKAGPMVLTNNTVDSVSYAFYVAADSVVITDNLLTRIQYEGIHTTPSFSNRALRTAAMLRNRVTCRDTTSYGSGIRADNAPGRIEDNVVRGCYYGIYAGNTTAGLPLDLKILRDSAGTAKKGCCGAGIYPDGRWRTTMYGDRVAGAFYGVYVNNTDSGTVKIDSTVISGAGYYGIYLYQGTLAASMGGTKNRIANNGTYGIYNAYHTVGTRSFTGGALTGNGSYSIYNAAPVAGGPPPLDASNNYWGSPTGPPVSGPNSIVGPVTATPFLTADPAGVPTPVAPFPRSAAAPRVLGAAEPPPTGGAPPSPWEPERSRPGRDPVKIADREARERARR